MRSLPEQLDLTSRTGNKERATTLAQLIKLLRTPEIDTNNIPELGIANTADLVLVGNYLPEEEVLVISVSTVWFQGNPAHALVWEILDEVPVTLHWSDDFGIDTREGKFQGLHVMFVDVKPGKHLIQVKTA